MTNIAPKQDDIFKMFGENPLTPLPEPTEEQLNSIWFNRIWNVIKTWDINVPGAYAGYCGATGNHAAAILNALVDDVEDSTEKNFDEVEQWR